MRWASRDGAANLVEEALLDVRYGRSDASRDALSAALVLRARAGPLVPARGYARRSLGSAGARRVRGAPGVDSESRRCA